MSVCHLDILSSRSIDDLLKPLGYGSHCREVVNGNPVLTLDYFSLLERLAKSLVRSIASLFDYARVPAKVQAPTVGYSTAHGLQSRSRCRRLFTYLGFRGATLITRPDIAVAVSIISKHVQCPSPCHCEGIKRVLRYLKGNMSKSRTYNGEHPSPVLTIYCDADWATYP
jgi:hypothetical protein